MQLTAAGELALASGVWFDRTARMHPLEPDVESLLGMLGPVVGMGVWLDEGTMRAHTKTLTLDFSAYWGNDKEFPIAIRRAKGRGFIA